MWKKWKIWDNVHEKSMLRAFARSRAKNEKLHTYWVRIGNQNQFSSSRKGGAIVRVTTARQKFCE